MKKQNFDVFGMSCASCQAHVDHAVNKLDGVLSCNVNLLTNSMEVSFDENKINEDTIIEAIQKVGYDAKIKGQIEIKQTASKKKKKK